MKYQLTPKKVEFGSNGFACVAGWATIYITDINTGEFVNATYEYVAEGIGLPDYIFLDAPDEVDDEHAIVRQGDKWTYPVDYRGKDIYSKATGTVSTVTHIGDIPDDFTLLKPTSEFDSWDGEKWVLDKEKQHQHDVAVAQSKQSQLLREVNAEIAHLQDAVDAEIATEQQMELLKRLKGYRFKLNQIDFDKAPNIDWGEKPE